MKASFNDAQHVLRTLVDAGHEAFLAGGCVRDLLLGLQPNDYDVTTSALPEEVQAIFPKTVPVGISFGVVKVVCDEGRELDVATFRTDGVYSDSRRPDTVTYGKTAAEDVQRRDFTINAMLQDIEGNIVDYIGGQADLKARVIRTVGNASDRFNEDPLRMMRALRFAVRYDMNIDRDAWMVIRNYKQRIRTISKERVTDELTKMFSYGNCDKAFWLLKKSGLWDAWFATSLDADDNFQSMFALAEVEPDVPFILPLSIIFYSTYAHLRENILKRLTLTTAQRKALASLLKHTIEIRTFLQEPIHHKRRMMQWDDKQLACKALEYLSEGSITHYTIGGEDTLLTVSQEMARVTAMGFPDALVNGNDLQAMGYVAGPIFTKMLAKIQDYQLGGLLDRPGVRAFLLNMFPAAPRRLEDGSYYDGMSPFRLAAACKKCGRTMSFMVASNEEGNIQWSTISSEIDVRTYGGQYMYVTCTCCSTRRKKSSFVKVGV